MVMSQEDLRYQVVAAAKLGGPTEVIKKYAEAVQLASVALLELLVYALVLVYDLAQRLLVVAVKEVFVELICPIIRLFNKLFPCLPQRVNVHTRAYNDYTTMQPTEWPTQQ